MSAQYLTACTWSVVASDLATLYPGLRTRLINTTATPALDLAGGAELVAGRCDVVVDLEATLRASVVRPRSGIIHSTSYDTALVN